MEIDKGDLEGKDDEAVFRRFIKHVVKTDEEMADKRTRQGQTTDLRLYITNSAKQVVSNVENISHRLTSDRNLTKSARRFFDSVIISEDRLQDGISWVEIAYPRYERTDEFVFFDRPDTTWIVTTERKKWSEQTIEKFIKYTPWLERTFLPPDNLEAVMEGIVDSEFSGFTAKYHSQHRDRKATLRFHGAEPGDLKLAEEDFGATPTRIEFDQRNSPAAAIQGSGSNDGEITLESVRSGSEDKALQTFTGVSDKFASQDSEEFNVATDSGVEFLETGMVVDEFTSIEIYGTERPSAENLKQEVEDEILNKNQYRYGSWGENTFFVYDKEHREIFELGIESKDLVLHAREGTTSLSLRDFCRHILGEFDSTYSIRKKETRVRA